jgi:hypothetical protein
MRAGTAPGWHALGAASAFGARSRPRPALLYVGRRWLIVGATAAGRPTPSRSCMTRHPHRAPRARRRPSSVPGLGTRPEYVLRPEAGVLRAPRDAHPGRRRVQPGARFVERVADRRGARRRPAARGARALAFGPAGPGWPPCSRTSSTCA